MKPSFSPRWSYAVVIVAGLLALVFFLLRGRSELDVLTSRPAPQPSRLSLLGRWTQPARQKLMPIREAIFGRRRVVEVSATVFELNPGRAFSSSLFEVVTGRTNDRAERVLVVRPDTHFREALIKEHGARVISGPRVTTAEGVLGQMGMMEKRPVGSATNVSMRDVGWWIDVETDVRRGGVELTCFFTSNEVYPSELVSASASPGGETFLRTNLALGARVKVPIGASVLLLGGMTNQNGQIIGALLSPVVLPRR